MSVVKSLTISYQLNNGRTYFNDASGVTFHYSILGITGEINLLASSSQVKAELRAKDAFKNYLFEETTTAPTRARFYGNFGGKNNKCYMQIDLGSNKIKVNCTGDYSATGEDFDSGIVNISNYTSSSINVLTLYKPAGSFINMTSLGTDHFTIELYFDNEPSGVNYSIKYCGNTLASGIGEESGIPAYYDGNEYTLYDTTVFNCKGCIMGGDLMVGDYNLKCGNKFMQDDVTVNIGGN